MKTNDFKVIDSFVLHLYQNTSKLKKRNIFVDVDL